MQFRFFVQRFIFLVVCAVNIAHGQNIESFLLPGEVINGHAKYENECSRCHRAFSKNAQKSLCMDCHKDIRFDVDNVVGFHGRSAKGDCFECHNEHKGRDFRAAAFDVSRFVHSETDFALKGAHGNPNVKCAKCHLPGKKYREATLECEACHKADDIHKGSLGPACAECHHEESWKKAKFDHDKADFKLLGKHVNTPCKDCHIDGDFQWTPVKCQTCHAKQDKHKRRFGDQCEKCHNARSWKELVFDHERDTQYMLKGLHEKVTCTACHTGMLYKEKLAVTCDSCHKQTDQRTGHKGRFGDRCDKCHNENSWKKALFSHDRDTQYRLDDSHAKVACASCHRGILYVEKLATACVSCHRQIDQEKAHKGRYGDKCETCHDASKWKSIRFDHKRDANYGLSGKHAKVLCDKCHVEHLYNNKLTQNCDACHKKDDKHKRQLGDKCQACHTADDWKQARFDHGLTKFPLLGKHAPLECDKCHATAAFKDAPKICVDCHDKDDKHKKSFTTKCEICHNAARWPSWRFDHNKKTRFILDGAHADVSCTECHTKPIITGGEMNDDCVSCHAGDDVHSGGYGKFCDKCHVSRDFTEIKAQ